MLTIRVFIFIVISMAAADAQAQGLNAVMHRTVDVVALERASLMDPIDRASPTVIPCILTQGYNPGLAQPAAHVIAAAAADPAPLISRNDALRASGTSPPSFF